MKEQLCQPNSENVEGELDDAPKVDEVVKATVTPEQAEEIMDNIESKAREQKTNKAGRIEQLRERIRNRKYYNGADNLIKKYKPDIHGLTKDEYRNLLVKALTPANYDELEAAEEIVVKYGDEKGKDIIAKIADDMRGIALEIRDASFASSVSKLYDFAGMHEKRAYDKELARIFTEDQKK